MLNFLLNYRFCFNLDTLHFSCLNMFLFFLFFFQVISIFVTIGIIFIPIGFASLFASERVIYLIVLYVVLIVKFNQWPLLNFTMKLKFAFFYMQVVEIIDHYDKDCVPLRYTDDKLAFIQSSKTNKTCIRRLTVSPILCYCYI